MRAKELKKEASANLTETDLTLQVPENDYFWTWREVIERQSVTQGNMDG